MSDQPSLFEDENAVVSAAQQNPLDPAFARMGLGSASTVKRQPAYQIVGDTKIPVSKSRGKMWKHRKEAATKNMSEIKKAWDEAKAYYDQDQSAMRNASEAQQGNATRYATRRLNDTLSITENIVYSNVRGIVPNLYAKNPIMSATAQPQRMMQSGDGSSKDQTVNEQRARALAKLVTLLFSMRTKPGVNLKPLAKKAITLSLLTNLTWFETGYTVKAESSEEAYKDLSVLSERFAAAKTTEELEEIEGQLLALEDSVEFLSPSGPWVRLHEADCVLIDGDAEDLWLSDAKWVMIKGMVPTNFLRAVYGRKSGKLDDEGWKSIYEPTHVLTGDPDTDQESYSIFNGQEGSAFGYGADDQTNYDKAKRTEVWYVWDRATRRMEMYNSKDWTWPIWVWDDPLKLDTFFPLTPLFFHESPSNRYAKGPVSYYLSQQDQINKINDEANRALNWARRNIFYDKSTVDRTDVEKILKGDQDTITGIKVPDGKTGKDMIFSIPPPSTNFANLFEKGPIYAAIDRIDATNEAQRGGQFKTNTTNKAIDYYATMGTSRNDERLDAVEDAIGDVGWKIAQLCLQHMTAEQVTLMINMDVAPFWKPINPLTDFDAMSITCVGGSSQKMTDSAKKQQALEIAQILSQMSKTAPGQVLKKVLELFSTTFDTMTFTKEDWDEILAELQAQTAAPSGVPGAESEASNTSQDPRQMILMVTKALSALPPDALQMIGTALAQGVPPEQIAQTILQPSQPQ